MNIYLVGASGLTVANAASDDDLQDMLDEVDSVLGSVGYGVGRVRYYELSDDDETLHTIVRSEAQVGELLALSRQPGADLDLNLSLNLFVVGGLSLSGSDAMGVSGGLPGPAGLHGTTTSGVILTSEFLGQSFTDRSGAVVDGNVFTAVLFHPRAGTLSGPLPTLDGDHWRHRPHRGYPRVHGHIPRRVRGFNKKT